MLFCAYLVTSRAEKVGIFGKVFHQNVVEISVSGSSKQYINGTKQMTKPEYAIYPWDKRYDWCSNCMRTYEEHPWIVFSLKNAKFKTDGYFVRAGCCYENSCCCEDEYYGYCVDCCLFSWSFQISDDGKTWTTVHQVQKDYSMKRCKEASYKFTQTYVSKYVRLFQDESCPGWPPCVSINKLELDGDIIKEDGYASDEIVQMPEDDEDVSIIGHISAKGNVNLI